MKRIISLSVLVCFALAGFTWSQPASETEPLASRSFKRIGTTKLRHGSRILCLAYSPNGEMLVAGGGNDPLRLWNPKTGTLVREINEPWVHAVTFSASGDNLVYAGYQKTVRIWNLKVNKEIGKLEGHKAAIKAVAIDPDTQIIASGSQDGAIFMWDWNTKRKIADLAGHLDEVTALAYTPDNNLLVSAGSDRVIHLWNTENNQSIRKLDAGCGVHALAVSADSKTLYSAGDDNLIRRWDLATGKQTGTFKGHDGMVVSLTIRGDTLISGSFDKTVRFWDTKTTEQKRSLPRTQGDCDALAVTNAGDFVASAGLSNTIRILDTATGKEVVHGDGPRAGLSALQLSPDNKRLAATTSAGQIIVWNAPVGILHREWDSKQTGDLLLAFAPDSKTLVTAADSACFWNVDSGNEIARLPSKGAAVSLAFSPDGKTLALAQRNGDIDLVDVNQKKSLNTLRHVGSLHAVAWSPDSKMLAAGGGSKIVIWDPATGNVTRSFDVKEGPPPAFALVASLAFDPDGRKLAAGCFDAMIRIYQLHEKNPTAERGHHLCDGHLSMPYAMSFSPDGRTLATGSFDKTVRLWEAFSGKQIAQFKGHIGAVMGVAFAADGRSVWSAGADAVVHQWDVPGLANNGTLPEVVLTPQELENAWTGLTADDTKAGHEIMWRCTAFAKQAIPNIAKKLYLLDPDRVKKLFKDLDSNHYATRQAAMGELTNFGRWMEGRYDAAMANPPSLEYKRRVETLKEKLTAQNSPSLAQERLRVRRFMLMCEQVGGPDAVDALKRIADKGPEEELREEAKGSLTRLKQR